MQLRELMQYFLTDWEEFKDLDWKNIFLIDEKPAWVFDTRICIDQNF